MYDKMINDIVKNYWFHLCKYEPHAAQEQIHNSVANNVVAVCGRRFGKSLCASKEAEALIFKSFKEGKKRIWIVAPTYDLSRKIFREVWDTFLIKQVLGSNIVKKKSESDTPFIEFKNGTEIKCKSSDTPDGLVGDSVDYMIFDECAKSKQIIWEKYLSPTLMDTKGKALFITTPEGTNWVWDLYLRGQNKEEFKNWDSFLFKSIDNTKIDNVEWLEERRKELTEETYLQEHEASPYNFTGLVFKGYERAVGLLKDFAPKQYIIGIDFGFGQPCAIVVMGTDGNRWQVYDEVYESGMQSYDIKKKLDIINIKYKISGIYADPSRPEMIAELRKNGFNIHKAKNVVDIGIDRVKKHFQSDTIKICERCKVTLREISQYRYDKTKDAPVKQNDHTVDAMRYVINSYESRSVPKMVLGAR